MNDGFARLSAWFDKYKILWYLLLAAMVAFGFDFQTPKKRFDTIDKRVTAMEMRIEVDRKTMNDISTKLSIILRIACRSDRANAELAGVDCI